TRRTGDSDGASQGAGFCVLCTMLGV
ncbi:hypothetical protein AB1N83_014276, partial [Pleurotus pulmonarius]